ncbi:MAG: PilX N-terminal domain-containing pilus assembly protein [Patescibacteria group bacterium]
MRVRVNKMRSRRGQILILVLLVVVVALAVGLSVASRNLTNLRSSTQAEQSQRAFTAAEGGIEDVLSKLNTVANVSQSGVVGAPAISGCTRNSDTTVKQADCSITTATGVTGTVKVLASTTYEKTIEPGDVAQINLDTYAVGKSFDVEWGKSDEINPRPSLEFTFICQGGSSCMGDSFSGTYGQHREAIQIETISGQSGFANCPSLLNGGDTCKKTFTIVTSANVKLLRMKPFWNRATVKVTPSDSATFPVQTYEITSTATTDTGVSRKVEVKRDALPQLPAIFDYVLYSGQDIIK